MDASTLFPLPLELSIQLVCEIVMLFPPFRPGVCMLDGECDVFCLVRN